MMGIVDVFDALTTDRVYRNRLSWEDACAVLQQEAGRGWRSPQLVEEFIQLCRSGSLQPGRGPVVVGLPKPAACSPQPVVVYSLP